MSDITEKVEKAMRNWARTDDELADMTADIVRLVAGVAAERDRLREALTQSIIEIAAVTHEATMLREDRDLYLDTLKRVEAERDQLIEALADAHLERGRLAKEAGLSDLKPCPFCGAPAEIERDNDHHGEWFNLGCSRHWGRVNPDEACCGGRLWYTADPDEEPGAIEAWNRRAEEAGR